MARLMTPAAVGGATTAGAVVGWAAAVGCGAAVGWGAVGGLAGAGVRHAASRGITAALSPDRTNARRESTRDMNSFSPYHTDGIGLQLGPSSVTAASHRAAMRASERDPAGFISNPRTRPTFASGRA